jgi:hypothetical protein
MMVPTRQYQNKTSAKQRKTAGNNRNGPLREKPPTAARSTKSPGPVQSFFSSLAASGERGAELQK